MSAKIKGFIVEANNGIIAWTVTDEIYATEKQADELLDNLLIVRSRYLRSQHQPNPNKEWLELDPRALTYPKHLPLYSVKQVTTEDL